MLLLYREADQPALRQHAHESDDTDLALPPVEFVFAARVTDKLLDRRLPIASGPDLTAELIQFDLFAAGYLQPAHHRPHQRVLPLRYREDDFGRTVSDILALHFGRVPADGRISDRTERKHVLARQRRRTTA